MAVAARDRVVEPGEARVVELEQLRHRAGQTPLEALGLGGEAPGRREPLEVGEPGGQHRAHRRAPTRSAAVSRRYASTHSPTTLWKWRTRISWSFKGNASRTHDSSAACVPPSMP